MIDLELSADQMQLLRAQSIDSGQPGTILKDFQLVLDYVGTTGVKAAGKYNLLPIESIADLNPLLSRPLRLDMTRPLLRSHPYLLGLHLLLRASGLSRTEGVGAKARLVLDPAVLAVWHGLNATEQYFTLLEAWLRIGRPEMIGERGGGIMSFLANCLTTWRHTPKSGESFSKEKSEDVYLLGIGRDFFHLALMDLFGLMEIKHPPQAVKPWHPAAVRHKPFGDAIFVLLAAACFDRHWNDDDLGEDGVAPAVSFGRWQGLFQPYFPEWRNNLVLPQAESRTGTFVFRVSLGTSWRLIAIDARSTLEELLGSILTSFAFDSEHLYGFTYRDRFGAQVTVGDPRVEEGPWADDVLVGDVPLQPGQAMELLYDYGDSWHFNVKLERLEPSGARIKKPRTLEKHGKAPEQYPNWEE